MSNADYGWRDTTEEYRNMQPQENPVTEVQENPIVSKLREAFDSATSAILEGTELAKSVVELRKQVDNLTASVSILERDLEYVRNRNRELDEQVTQVRRARDEAIQEASQHRDRANTAEAELGIKQAHIDNLTHDLDVVRQEMQNLRKARDDMELRAMEAEEKLVAAEAKLLQIEGLFKPKQEPEPQPSTTAWPSQSQPRDPVTQQWKSPYDSGSQGTY